MPPATVPKPVDPAPAPVYAPAAPVDRGRPPERVHPPLTDEERARLDALQERIGVQFRHQSLLQEAMTHASWNNERGELSGPGHDNERLEYLGDAVLELVVGEYLFRRFPGYDEGQLTQLRAALVNTVSLARLAERLDLGTSLLFGKGAEKTGARQLPSLLANAFEALIGAIFLDQGYRVATRVFLQNIGDLAEWGDENYKGRLQEVAQEKLHETPIYRVASAAGPGHRREYRAEAIVAGDIVGRGEGATKQAAEQSAAHAALDKLKAPTKGPARRAAGAARAAARSVAGESPRVRRRVAEVAADRGASAGSPGVRRKPGHPEAPPPRRGLLSALRAAAETLVGRKEPEPPPPPKSRSRRGRRGGRGRGGGGPGQRPASGGAAKG